MTGETIRRLRTERGMNRQELAQLLGISSTAVYKWEVGQTHPSTEMLQKLATLFQVSVDELMGLASAPQSAAEQNMLVMTRAFTRLTPEEQEKYLAVGRALFRHAFSGEEEP